MAEKDTPEPATGRLRTQQAIFNSEFCWYGGLRDSSHIHDQLDRPRPELRDAAELHLRMIRFESTHGGSDAAEGCSDIDLEAVDSPEGPGHVLYERTESGWETTFHEGPPVSDS